MNASQFPGQTLQPTPGINDGEDQYSVLQKINQILYNEFGDGGGGGGTPTPATPQTGTASPTPAGVNSLLVVFSSDFTGSFDGNTIQVSQTPSLSFTSPVGKSLPSYAIVTTAGSFWWETLT